MYSRTWISDVKSKTFCPDGSNECTDPYMPSCQDRTIRCLDELPIPPGFVKAYIARDVNDTTNATKSLFDNTPGAQYRFACQDPGKIIQRLIFYTILLVNIFTNWLGCWLFENSNWSKGTWPFHYLISPYMPSQRILAFFIRGSLTEQLFYVLVWVQLNK